MDTTLIIMAAGIGSRFGEGIKQLAKMGPNGENATSADRAAVCLTLLPLSISVLIRLL